MKSLIVHPDAGTEFLTPERCAILETWNDSTDPDVSIARARVEPGVRTQLHHVNVDERYLIIQGCGIASIGKLRPAEVGPGDVVVIPARTPQQITNSGDSDLVFYCICSPRFSPDGYTALGEA